MHTTKVAPSGYHWAPQSAQSESKSHLSTVKIQKKQNIKELRHVAENWYKIAKDRYKLAKNFWFISSDKKDQAEDSKIVTGVIGSDLYFKANKVSAYVAYDEFDQIQGIALARIGNKGANWLEDLATHPENLPIFGHELPVKGVGTALLTHVIKQVYEKMHNNKKLHLKALPSAIAFYQKFGFMPDPKRKAADGITPMILKRSQMRSVLEEQLPKLDIVKKEPNLSKMQSIKY